MGISLIIVLALIVSLLVAIAGEAARLFASGRNLSTLLGWLWGKSSTAPSQTPTQTPTSNTEAISVTDRTLAVVEAAIQEAEIGRKSENALELRKIRDICHNIKTKDDNLNRINTHFKKSFMPDLKGDASG